MEKVTIKDKEYTINEIKYSEVAGLAQLEQKEAAKQIILASTKMTEEEYNDLSLKDGIKIQKIINDINGLEDFQQPLTK